MEMTSVKHGVPHEKKKRKKKTAHGQNRDSAVDTAVFHGARDLFNYPEVK